MAVDAETSSQNGFLEYHEPGPIELLILFSFFFFLALAEWVSDKIFKAGLIGQILVGMLYGVPIGNIMPMGWQETFVSLGYIGLILIIFEGGLTVHLALLKANIILSACAAVIGILVPFGLCYALLYAGWGFGAVETFIVGAALSVTSLGTTFVVIASAGKGIDLPRTRIGTVLITAAVISDVSGLVMASVIHNLGSIDDGGTSIGWLVGSPVLASIAMGVFSPLIAKYLASPIFRWYIEDNFARYKHISNVILMVFVLCAFLSIAGFSGASPLYGAFLAGTFLTSLPCIHPLGPFSVLSREHGETDPDKTPTFVHTFEKYFLDARQYILQPMFFASVGFAIPFRQLWTGNVVWRGFVFALVMLFGKLIVGAIVPVYELTVVRPAPKIKNLAASGWRPVTLLGVAMIARGEIGLLIIQIGLNQTPFLSEQAFLIATWATILSTIIGPVVVGLLLKRHGRTVSADVTWGVQKIDDLEGWTSDDDDEDERGGRWASRRHSRSVSRAASERSRSRATSRVQSRAQSRAQSLELGRREREPRRSLDTDEPLGLPRSPLPPGANSSHKASLPDLRSSERDLTASDEKIAGDMTPMQQRWARKRVITYEDSTTDGRTRNSITEERPVSRREARIEEVPTPFVDGEEEKAIGDAGLGDRVRRGQHIDAERTSEKSSGSNLERKSEP